MGFHHRHACDSPTGTGTSQIYIHVADLRTYICIERGKGSIETVEWDQELLATQQNNEPDERTAWIQRQGASESCVLRSAHSMPALMQSVHGVRIPYRIMECVFERDNAVTGMRPPALVRSVHVDWTNGWMG